MEAQACTDNHEVLARVHKRRRISFTGTISDDAEFD